jgi:hypothetical protein
MFVAELKQFPVPVWTVPGNHEIFGIERDKSKVSTTHRRKADPGDHHSPGDGAGETVAVPSPADVEAFCREFMLLCARYGMVPGRKLPNSETFPADLGKRTYLSIGQLAAYLGDKTIPSARKWLEKNPCVRRSLEGRKVLVWRRDVEAQLERHATQQAKRR